MHSPCWILQTKCQVYLHWTALSFSYLACFTFYSVAYLGGAIGPWPPLWVARIAKLYRKVSKIEAWPHPFASWASGFGLEINGRKMGRNLSEDLFFFALHLILGEKWDEI